MRLRLVTLTVLLAAGGGVAAGPARSQDRAPSEKPDAAIRDGSAARALTKAKARWKAHGGTNYRFKIRRQCFCPPTYTAERTVTVRGGKPVHPPSQVKEFATVPRLFRIVRQAIADGVVNLDVTYDKTYGYPRSIFIDRSRMIADEEQGYAARGLKKLT